MRVLLLRFDAPLMSFGGVAVDERGETDYFPGASFLAGLLGNALGYDHREFDRLQALQDRLRYAARWDVPPETVLDYQTADLGQPRDDRPARKDTGWTTRGYREDPKGGTASSGTQQRYRWFHAGGVMTVAIALRDEILPTVDDLAVAIRHPARPLFLGRKPCLPAAPLFFGVVEATGLRAALRDAARDPRSLEERMRACWPEDEGLDGDTAQRATVFDRRSWRDQAHVGSRVRLEGWL